MKKTSLFVATAATGLAALGLVATGGTNQAIAADKEKCYGVVKAGKNDCGSKANNHSCAGQATVDGDANEWVYVPKGLCERLNNGTLGGEG